MTPIKDLFTYAGTVQDSGEITREVAQPAEFNATHDGQTQGAQAAGTLRQDFQGLVDSRYRVAPAAPVLLQSRPDRGRVVGRKDTDLVDKSPSDARRGKYVEVMRSFQSGALLDTRGRPVTDRRVAKGIAAELARQADTVRMPGDAS